MALVCLMLSFGLTSCKQEEVDPDSQYAKIVSIRRSDPPNALIQAERAYRRFGKEQSETGCRFRLLYADVLLDASQWNKAAPLLQAEPPLGPQHPKLAARLALSRVRLASKQADWQLTESWLKEAARLLPQAHDPCLESEFLTSEVQNLISEQRFQDSTRRLAGMETVTQSCSDPYWEALRLYLNGTNLGMSLRFEEAIDSYQSSLALARRNNLSLLVPALLGNLVTCHLYLGDDEMAERRLNEAASYQKASQPRARSLSHGRRGYIYAARERYDKAAVEFAAAIQDAKESHYRPYVVFWLNELTSLSCKTGDLKAAADLNREALGTADRDKDRDEYRNAELNGARIARLRKDFERAYSLLKPLGSYRDSNYFQWQYHGELAQLLAAMNRNAEARVEFERTLKAAEALRRDVKDIWNRMTFSSKFLELSRRQVEFLIDQKDFTGALRIVESFHARQLLEELQSTEEPQAGGGYPGLARAQHAVILSYWIGPERSYMWVTTAKGSHMFPLGNLKRLDAQIKDYRQEIEDGTNFLRAAASSISLYGELIAPAASLIPEHADVIVIPDGPLADLNFETLIAPERPGQYWLERVSLRVAPSLALLHKKERETGDDIGRVLVVGATLPPPEFPTLPGSQREIDTIERLFRSKQPIILSGDGATPQKLWQANLGQFSLIHLSAHAVALRENPLDSFIVLTPEKAGGNFKLYARQLASMKLHANLVTLSACQGAGQKVPGEGLVGLTWAVLSAGAHNVVAGLWNVADRPTADFMDYFYSSLQKGQSPSQALRSAKLEMLGHQAAPYYWAAFQLYSR